MKVDELYKYFPVKDGAFSRAKTHVRAVDGVSFEIYRGETLGLVGESGCGKSTLGRLLVRLQNATRGEVVFDGHNLMAMSARKVRQIRGDMQMIFQDPSGSLNPRFSVGSIIAEPMQAQGIGRSAKRTARIAELLGLVGLDPSAAKRYPHEFSGGQRQRIGIARAMALSPKFVVADEPVSALDVSVQSQVVNLMVDLQQSLDLTYVFIAHGLDIVRHISDRVAVMYLGQIVEIAGTDQIFDTPAHPYTHALLSSVPVPDPGRARDRIILRGDIPSPTAPPSGCRFRTRCPRAQALCAAEAPALKQIGPGQQVACHFPISYT